MAITGIVLALLVAAIWFLVGPMVLSLVGQHRDRESAIETWAQTEAIKTRLGEFIGRVKETPNGRVMAFLGIRYAEPPIGEGCFKPAIPSKAWDGIYEATTFPNSPIQVEADAMTREPNSAVKSEDSLFLSVYTPSTEGANRPVLFWIHGGAFQYGTSNGIPALYLRSKAMWSWYR